GDTHRVLEAGRYAVRPAEVHSGAERDRRELGVAARDPVHDLVQRSVAADSDDEPCAVGDRLPGELDQVSGPLREQRLAAETEQLGAAGELGPALTGRAVRRRRVDQEDGGCFAHAKQLDTII